jgi:nucleotide-binding universal stress UspA family protein
MTDMNEQLIGRAEVIALATDGSSCTDGAVQEAVFLAQTCGARLVVLHVIPIDSESAMGAQAFSEVVRNEISSHVDSIHKMAKDADVPCKVLIEESYQPDKIIVELARQEKADLLIMGRHGRTGLLKLLVGSMTAKVIGHRFPKVLVVPSDFSLGGERILVAVDGSKASDRAAEEAVGMSAHCTYLKEVYAVSVASSEDGLAHAQELAEAVCAQGRAKAPHVTFHALTPVGRHAPDIIADLAKENNVDMILVGGYGKGLTKLLMGHVTEKVIGKAHCAVLVLDAQEEVTAKAE